MHAFPQIPVGVLADGVPDQPGLFEPVKLSLFHQITELCGQFLAALKLPLPGSSAQFPVGVAKVPVGLTHGFKILPQFGSNVFRDLVLVVPFVHRPVELFSPVPFIPIIPGFLVGFLLVPFTVVFVGQNGSDSRSGDHHQGQRSCD